MKEKEEEVVSYSNRRTLQLVAKSHEMTWLYALEENLVIKNTYKLPSRRLGTWKSSLDNVNQVVINKTDSFLAAYPGADIRSYHNPLYLEYLS